MIKINGIEYDVDEFAFEGCHKCYLIENNSDKKDAIEFGYKLYPIEQLPKIWKNTCPLRLIDTWSLKSVVEQFEKDVVFELSDGRKFEFIGKEE